VSEDAPQDPLTPAGREYARRMRLERLYPEAPKRPPNDLEKILAELRALRAEVAEIKAKIGGGA